MNSIHVVIRFFVIRLCEAYFDILPRQIVKSSNQLMNFINYYYRTFISFPNTRTRSLNRHRPRNDDTLPIPVAQDTKDLKSALK